jgi:putative ABC transport system permease protein
MWNDLPQALRGLGHDRSFTVTAILTLAVGIGANTAIYSLVNGVLLRPPGYHEPGRLVAINVVAPKFLKSYPELPVNIGIYFEWRKRLTSFEGIAIGRGATADLTGDQPPEQVKAAQVSANMFRVLGISPSLGRSFDDREDTAGRDGVAMISDSLWRRRFRGDPSIVGRKILVDGSPCEVVGVLPAGFRFPREEKPGPRALGEWIELYRPLGYAQEQLGLYLGDFNYQTTARLRPGVSLAQARAEINVLQADISKRLPQDVDLMAVVTPLQERMSGSVREALWLLMAAVGAVLLVSCVNLANLSLARASGRARDAAIRTALGASRGRLARERLVESVLLAGAGGVLGVALAEAGVRVLVALAPIDVPRLAEVTIDGRVLLFALAVSLGCALAFGILPALRAPAAVFEALKSGGRSSTEGRSGTRLLNGLVSAEVALSAALLVTAGLLLASFGRLVTIDKGFDVERVLALDLSLPAARYEDDAQRAAFYQRLLNQVRSLPGIQSASLISALPLQGETWIDIVSTEHDSRPPMDRPSTNVRFISPDYFRTLHARLREGRDFEERDRGRQVAVISASLAERLWPGQSAVGRKLMHRELTEVVGVTPDLRSTSLDHEPVNMLYLPYWQQSRKSSSLVIRTGEGKEGLANTLRRTVWDIDSEVTIPSVRTLEEVMSQSVAARRFQTILVLLFAAAGVALAAFGAYGVLAYSVQRRTPEMGIRMALGASRAAVLGLVLREGMMPVIGGLAAGGLAALALGRYLESLLFHVSARDPVAFAITAAVLSAVCLVACLIPARRATRANPAETLRFE